MTLPYNFVPQKDRAEARERLRQLAQEGNPLNNVGRKLADLGPTAFFMREAEELWVAAIDKAEERPDVDPGLIRLYPERWLAVGVKKAVHNLHRKMLRSRKVATEPRAEIEKVEGPGYDWHALYVLFNRLDFKAVKAQLPGLRKNPMEGRKGWHKPGAGG